MYRLITVKLADVYPLEDEYGNQYTSRDYSAKANQDYVHELAESMRAKGVPDEPISVVADGGIYRIKTGNSRVMAMRELGTAECEALIDDDDTVQSVLEAVIRTDTKKKYEAVEKSRFVQQLFLFGDDQYVSEVSGIEAGKVKRIRRASMAIDDAAEDMTLDRLLLIEEFCDDPEAVKKLTDCREADAQNVAWSLRRGREISKKVAEFAEAFEAEGVPASEDRSDVGGMVYFIGAADPESVAERLPEEFEPGQVKALLVRTWDGCRAEIYISPELSDGSDDERAEFRRQKDAYEAALKAMDESRFSWFWKGLAEGRPMPNLLRECAEEFKGNYYVEQAVKAMGEECLETAKGKGLSVYDYAMGFSAIDTEGSRWFAGALASGSIEQYRMGTLSSYIDELALYRADGWDPGESHGLIKRLSDIADAEESEEDDG